MAFMGGFSLIPNLGETSPVGFFTFKRPLSIRVFFVPQKQRFRRRKELFV